MCGPAGYEERVVCFIDLLGFSDHIAQSVGSDGTEIASKISEIAHVFSTIRDQLSIDQPDNRQGVEISQFSDSVVISFPVEISSGVFWTLLDILHVQVSLVFHGYLCRGGVTLGKVVHTSTLLYGPAMIAAYELESRNANYPRVIMDDSILQAAMQAPSFHHGPTDEAESIRGLVDQDTDGWYYINYIENAQSELDDPQLDYPRYLKKLAELIVAGLRSSDNRVVSKYEWLREKYSSCVDNIKAGIDSNLAEDDELAEAYLSIPDLI